MADSYYAATAYNSTRPRNLKPGDNSGFGLGTRKLRERPLNIRSAHCREFLAYDYVDTIDLFKEDRDRAREELNSPGHECQYWENLQNPRVAVRVITGLAGLFSFIGGGQ